MDNGPVRWEAVEVSGTEDGLGVSVGKGVGVVGAPGGPMGVLSRPPPWSGPWGVDVSVGAAGGP